MIPPEQNWGHRPSIDGELVGIDEEAIYSCVFVDDPHRLIYRWGAHPALPPLFPHNPPETVQYAHHMTLKFKPTPEDLGQIPIGARIPLLVTGWAADDKCQTAAINLRASRPRIFDGNLNHHITMAVNGVSPVYSNELLEKGLVHDLDLEGFGWQIMGRVGYMGTKGSKVFSLAGTPYEHCAEAVYKPNDW